MLHVCMHVGNMRCIKYFVWKPKGGGGEHKCYILTKEVNKYCRLFICRTLLLQYISRL
jgi:hypothetical protein